MNKHDRELLLRQWLREEREDVVFYGQTSKVWIRLSGDAELFGSLIQ